MLDLTNVHSVRVSKAFRDILRTLTTKWKVCTVNYHCFSSFVYLCSDRTWMLKVDGHINGVLEFGLASYLPIISMSP